MRTLIRQVASLKLTLAGMAALAILSLAGARSEVIDVSWTIVPLALLSLNLLAAIFTNRSFRTQTGLLIFHVGLLFVFACIGLTLLTRFDGRVEVLQGVPFDSSAVTVVQRGWMHRGKLDSVRFELRDLEVDYLPGLLRQRTNSEVEILAASGARRLLEIDDQRGAEFSGYRFLATANKGFALVLGWEDASGARQFGAVHLPSYPMHDWKQLSDWTTPAGQRVQLELLLDRPPLATDAAWTLRLPTSGYRVQVRAAGTEIGVVMPGESVELSGGRLMFADLRLWMGYSIDYYPFLPWMLVAALLAIVGLAMHFGARYLPQADHRRAAVLTEAPDAHVVGA